MNMIKSFILFLLLQYQYGYAQDKEVKPPDTPRLRYKPEIFTSGFFDVTTSGQINSSARFIRLFIGEPGKLSIPLSVYSGISNNNLDRYPSNRNNDHLIFHLMNPLSGMVNVSIEGIVFINKRDEGLTKFGLVYHFGEKVLSGVKPGPDYNPLSVKNINFINTYGNTGLYFQSGAWDRLNASNMGIFWVLIRYLASYSPAKQLRDVIPALESDRIYHGYSVGWGVEINRLVNIKVIYYNYVKAPDLNYAYPLYQFSCNYSLK